MSIKKEKIKHKSGGFIKTTILVVAGLVLLEYAFDIDILEKAHEVFSWFWAKYGGHILSLWSWLKLKISTNL